jgi:NADH-quinone oxidoreductase subunit K
MNLIITFLPAILLFILGLTGILLNRKNLLIIIFSIELILLSINFSFLLSSFYLDDLLGQVFTVFILTIAAAETSIGLAILITYYRISGTLAIDNTKTLKG